MASHYLQIQVHQNYQCYSVVRKYQSAEASQRGLAIDTGIVMTELIIIAIATTARGKSSD